MISKWIGESLIFVVALPIFAFQTAEGLLGLIEVFGQISEYTRMK
ncbi:MAG TPA: hypothetical protein VE710_00115 [Candidatus Bathyarchaeia archaeon]|nr:hypothetical protein [Candidatus Bathyarchaeia archaeon]